MAKLASNGVVRFLLRRSRRRFLDDGEDGGGTGVADVSNCAFGGKGSSLNTEVSPPGGGEDKKFDENGSKLLLLTLLLVLPRNLKIPFWDPLFNW